MKPSLPPVVHPPMTFTATTTDPGEPGDPRDRPSPGYLAQARAVLTLLDLPEVEALWVVSRKDGDTWQPLEVQGSWPDPDAPASTVWADSLCHRMATFGRAVVIERVDSHPAYSRTPQALRLGVAGYLGAPVTRPDGGLHGSLCALLPRPARLRLGLWQARLAAAAVLLENSLRHEALAEADRRLRKRAR